MMASTVDTFSPLRCYGLEAKFEFLRMLRTPSFALPTLLFPGLFYVLFGVLLGGSRGGAQAARALLANYGVFGVMGAALFGFGVSIAVERERGFLTLRRALPAPAGAYLLGKMAMAMLFAGIISLLIGVLASSLAGVSLQPTQWLALLLVNVLGVVPFCAIGMFIGSLVSGSAAPAVTNLVYLPMALLSGLWLPLKLLPVLLAKFAVLWPAYHLSQIALKVVDQDAGSSVSVHLAALGGASTLFFLLARWRLARSG